MAEENETVKDVFVVDEPCFDEHYARRAHPERPERLVAAREGLKAGLKTWVSINPVSDVRGFAAQVHSAEYVGVLDSVLGDWGQLDPDTYICPTSGPAVWAAAGAAAAVADKVCEGQHAIGLVRPPGHHARPSTAMGFCVLNNVAIAAAAALARGAARVAILDWDVHHGNGTQEMFWRDDRVLFVSVHQFPFYPGSGAPEEIGEGPGRYHTINVGLPAGSGPEAYGEVFRRVVRPALNAAAPDVLFISAGFDAHAADPLAGQQLDAATYGAFTSVLQDDHGALGILLEGGYDLDALSASICEVGKVLRGDSHELPTGRLRDTERAAIERTLRAHKGSPFLTNETP